MKNAHKQISLLSLSIGALGVVYGDIGTSPLYAVSEIFASHGGEITSELAIGVISLLLWSLTIIVSIKYILFVLRADNKGEGGVFALLSLIQEKLKKKGWLMILFLLFAAGLLYGDGVITPAISVLSAVEGLKVITETFDPYIIPVTVGILVLLFAMQKSGTEKVGKLFGPIIVVWFLSIGTLGVRQVALNPAILAALNPLMALRFIANSNLHTLMLIMGSVMLVITGGEAMYADMGHFGKKPIQLSWFTLVFPALILNYLGQGAYLLSGAPIVGGSIFYSLVPHELLVPMVILATLATVIASQALISGAFSLTSQAVSLGFLPRIKIVYTNENHSGQIYVPAINWLLLIGCMLLIWGFQSSARLASAYGLAVSADMVITSVSMIIITHLHWKWPKIKSIAVFSCFLLIESFFLSSNLLKLVKGGWIPLLIAVTVAIIMFIWNWGNKVILRKTEKRATMNIVALVEFYKEHRLQIDRTGVFFTPVPVDNKFDVAPPVIETYLKRNSGLPKKVILLHVEIANEAYISEDRYKINEFYRDEEGYVTGVTVRFGFMEEHNVEKVLDGLAEHHELPLESDHRSWILHLLAPRMLIAKNASLIEKFSFRLYKLMSDNSQHADRYFGLGKDLDLSIEAVPVHIK